MPEVLLPPRRSVPLEIEQLRYSYPESQRPALREVNLSLGAGELALLAGRSASGK